MLIRESTLRKIVRKYLVELNWRNSNDIDFPAKGYSSDNARQFDVDGLNLRQLKSARMLYIKSSNFNPIEDPFSTYNVEGETHGLESHALKHMIEFAPEQTLSVMESIKQRIIDDGLEVYLYISNDSVPVQISAQSIQPGDLVNTLDRINDSIINNEPVSFIEQQLYTTYFLPLAQSYDAMGDYIVNNATDVSDASYQDVNALVKYLLTSPIIKFNGLYGNTINTYYYDMTNTALVSAKGPNNTGAGPFATIFRITKKFREESPKQALRHFKQGKSTTPDAQTCSTFIKAIEVIQAM